jgi:ankyrin repeat protein
MDKTRELADEILDNFREGKIPDSERILSLIAEGADVNAQDNFGWNRYLAALCGDEKYDPILKLLLENGADPNLEGRMGGGDTILDQMWTELILEQDGLSDADKRLGKETALRLREQTARLEQRIVALREMGFEGGGW